MKKWTLLSLLWLANANAQAISIPQSVIAKYQGNFNIPATMSFTRTGNNYTIVAQVKLFKFNFRYESGGTIVNNTLRPKYYREIRNGKVYASTKMGNNQVIIGKTDETRTETVNGNVMDLFTLSWQLAFNNGKLPDNLYITNGKKLYKGGSLSYVGKKKISLSGQDTVMNQYIMRQGSDTVQYAFVPDFANVPAVIAYVDNGKQYNLTLKSVTIKE